MTKKINEAGPFKSTLAGTEWIEIQDGSGIGSSKYTTAAAIAALVVVPAPLVSSVQGKQGAVVLVKADIDLGNVDNTADLDKPVSTATQAALDLKANISGQVFTGAISAPAISVGADAVIHDGNFYAKFDARLATQLPNTDALTEGSVNRYYHDSLVHAYLPTTDALSEGISNLYFHRSLVNDMIATIPGTYKSYDPITGILTIGSDTGADPSVISVNGRQGIVILTTDDVGEGANKYFPEAPVDGIPYVRKDGAWLAYVEEVITVSSASGILDLDLAGGLNKTFKTTLTEDTTLTLSNLPTGNRVGEFELEITEDSTGGWIFTLPASMKALGNSDTLIKVDADSVTVLSAKSFDQGTTFRYAMQESA